MPRRTSLLATLIGAVAAAHLLLLLGLRPVPVQGPRPPVLRVRGVVEAPAAPARGAQPVVSSGTPGRTEAHAAAQPTFWPAEQLERRPVPVSAPDTRRLDGVVLSGLPLRLRLCIDATGRVVALLPLSVTPDDAAALPRLHEMFAATAFIPGRRGGRDVASLLDLELSVQSADDGAAMGESGLSRDAAAPPPHRG